MMVRSGLDGNCPTHSSIKSVNVKGNNTFEKNVDKIWKKNVDKSVDKASYLKGSYPQVE